MSRATLDSAASLTLSRTRLSRSPVPLSNGVLLAFRMTSAVRTPVCTHTGLGSSAFARRYLRNHSYFLFLRLLRCFSSPGSLPYAMDLRTDTFRWVSPFRHPRIYAYVQLPVAFRSLSRLSSALSAKASALRPYSLNLFVLVLLCSPSSYIALYDESLLSG